MIRWGVRPSNGTDGDFQRADTCDHCRRDHAWHLAEEAGDSCLIIMDALVGEHSYPNPDGPPQWGRDEESGVYVCSEYDGPCSCGDHRLPDFKALSSAFQASPGLSRGESGEGVPRPDPLTANSEKEGD